MLNFPLEHPVVTHPYNYPVIKYPIVSPPLLTSCALVSVPLRQKVLILNEAAT